MISEILTGYRSGYNFFDIVWYFIRKPFINLMYGYYLGPKLVPAKLGFLQKLESTHTSGYQHIVSPITRLYHKVLYISPTYYDCLKCRQQMFLNSPCRFCLIKNNVDID